MKKILFCFCVLSYVFVFLSCGKNGSTLEIATDISASFPLKYGVVYSDEFDEEDDHFFSLEMKRMILGENAEKYDYILSVSGYFSRDRVSGAEVMVILLDDRSHRSEITSALYRRAAKKQDAPTRVFCEGDLVFFICADEPEQIVEYIKSKI